MKYDDDQLINTLRFYKVTCKQSPSAGELITFIFDCKLMEVISHLSICMGHNNYNDSKIRSQDAIVLIQLDPADYLISY